MLWMTTAPLIAEDGIGECCKQKPVNCSEVVFDERICSDKNVKHIESTCEVQIISHFTFEGPSGKRGHVPLGILKFQKNGIAIF